MKLSMTFVGVMAACGLSGALAAPPPAAYQDLEARQKALAARVRYAALQITLNEEYRAHLDTDLASSLLEFRNATVQGLQTLILGVSILLVFLLQYGPSLLFCGLVLYWPGRLVWRRWQAARTA